MDKSLFQISQEYQNIISLLEEDELTPELEKGLQITQTQLSEKCSNYVKAIAQLESDAQLAKEYEAKARLYRKRKEKAVSRLKHALLQAVDAFGTQKFGITEVKLRKSQSVEIIDIDSLPDRFVKVKVSKVPDKGQIAKHIKEGNNIEGARLIENQNLQIK